jgi:hypothetical protein
VRSNQSQCRGSASLRLTGRASSMVSPTVSRRQTERTINHATCRGADATTQEDLASARASRVRHHAVPFEHLDSPTVTVSQPSRARTYHSSERDIVRQLAWEGRTYSRRSGGISLTSSTFTSLDDDRASTRGATAGPASDRPAEASCRAHQLSPNQRTSPAFSRCRAPRAADPGSAHAETSIEAPSA